jgi:hypothetical protein
VIYSFLNFILVLGGDLDLKAKNLPKGGLMIPFVIPDLMDSGFSTFWNKAAGQSSSQISRALYMIICKFNYIIINSEVNEFSLFGRMILQLLNHTQIVG